MPTTYCKNCGTQLQDPNIKFCSNCGSQVVLTNPQGNAGNAIWDMSAVNAKLKLPAIGIMVSAGINFVVFLFGLMWLGDVPELRSTPAALRLLQILCILFLLAFAFSIYGAVQMMNARKHGVAVTSAIINISTILCGVPIGVPFGIWALVVLLKPEIKSAFARNSVPTA